MENKSGRDAKTIRKELQRARMFLQKAEYAVDNGLPCPRCRESMTKHQFREGLHPCVGIERENKVALRHELKSQTEPEETPRQSEEPGQWRQPDYECASDLLRRLIEK